LPARAARRRPQPTKEIAVLRGHDGPVLYAAFSPDGTLIVTAPPGSIQLEKL
jgi:hypothetical protein